MNDLVKRLRIMKPDPLERINHTVRGYRMERLEAAKAIEALEAERDRLREVLSLIAVVGFSEDPKVNQAIARQVVQQARDALNEKPLPG